MDLPVDKPVESVENFKPQPAKKAVKSKFMSTDIPSPI